MRTFQEKRRIRRIFFSKPALAIMFVIALISAVEAGKMAFKAYQAQGLQAAALAEKLKIEDEKTNLEQKIQQLDTPEGLEKEAKERFNVTKPGERVLIIVGSDPVASSSSRTGSGFWGYIKRLFGR